MKAIRTKINHIPLLTPAKGGAFERGIIAARMEHRQSNDKHILQERVVYSLLAYRSRKGLAASVREISRTLGLHHATVKKTLNNLTDLVHQHDGKWTANEPPNEWFRSVEKHTVKHWSERYAYTWLLLPRQGGKFLAGNRSRHFSLNHAVIYSYLDSLAKKDGTIKRFTHAGISTMLQRMNPKTVKSTISDLATLELIEPGYKTIKILPFVEKHYELFAPPQKLVANTPYEERSCSRPTTNNYEIKNDGYDDHRELCRAYMTQSYAERVIRAIQFLGVDIINLQIHLEDRKKESEQNVKSGKCAVENFGKFFVTPYEERVATIIKERQIADAEQRRIEYQNSEKGKAAEAKQQEVIAADPTHPMHTVDVKSILDRVRFSDDLRQNWRDADCLNSKVRRHCHRYVATLGLNHQSSIDRTGSLTGAVRRQALSTVNHHYDRETRATPGEFQSAIDDAISKIQPAMPRMFEQDSVS